MSAPNVHTVMRASELVNSHWNGDYCPRDVAITAITAALEAETESCAKVADAFAGNYPVDVFIPLDSDGEFNDGSPEWTARVSADMSRYSSKQIAQAIRRRAG